MIRVELGSQPVPGVWLWKVCGQAVDGRSRTPLLDACRALKSMGADTRMQIGLFRPRATEADLSCSIGVGAAARVVEKRTTRFAPFRPFGRVFEE
jgi:uncharacterized metal-binding protein